MFQDVLDTHSTRPSCPDPHYQVCAKKFPDHLPVEALPLEVPVPLCFWARLDLLNLVPLQQEEVTGRTGVGSTAVCSMTLGPHTG